MTTSGTATYTPDFTEIAEEAWERAGREMRSGYDLRTARRSMNLLTIEWQNRGLSMWTFEEGSIPIVAGTATYNLPADTIDLLEQVCTTGTGQLRVDIPLTRISVSTYAGIPNKNVTGRPLQAYIKRALDNPTITLWPIPDDSQTYTLRYWRMRRIQDAGNGVETPDVQFRFYPALVAGLAYYIAMKVPELESRLPMLKQEYEQQFDLAAGEDRDKASVHLVPFMR